VTAIKVSVVFGGKQGPTATQMISFGQPLDPATGPVPARIHFESAVADAAEIERALEASRPDLLVLSRYTSALGVDWIRSARAAGVPSIFHIDDDLLAVPPSLGEAKFKAYNKPERLKALRDNIEAADLLYLSTEGLGQRFADYQLRTPIVVGDVYCSVDPDAVGALLPPASGPVIGYMGTGGHSADLAMIMPAICEAMDLVPELQFEVFGTIDMPEDLARFGSRARHLAPVADYAEFLRSLRTLGWWVGLAPLEDNAFNRCKADTKWVEYSMAGIAVVASDLPVYHRACAGGSGILAGSNESWLAGLTDLISQPQHRSWMIEKAQAKLRQIYSRERLRDQVMAVFEQALGRT